MDALGLLTGALLALVVALLIVRERPPPADDEPAQPARGDRLEVILAHISGDAVRDRPLLNRALALGPTVVPSVIEALTEALRDPDGAPPERVARLEELIADFGLAAVGPVCDQLSRLRPTVPLCASLSRVIRRLGQPGVQASFARAIAQPALAPFLPRLQAAARDPGAALTGALAQRPTVARRIALDTMAGLLADHPEVIDDLWLAWDP
ncbi:MAG: hypothetical protein KC613_10350, partial [Myxococcales bacterium]|nr:hypothetical protein [Myxococcales bacterium]